jgi:hypothetical protein
VPLKPYFSIVKGVRFAESKLNMARIIMRTKVTTFVIVKVALKMLDFSIPRTNTSVKKYKKTTARREHF